MTILSARAQECDWHCDGSSTEDTDWLVDPGGTFLIDGDKNHRPYNNNECLDACFRIKKQQLFFFAKEENVHAPLFLSHL